MKTENGTKTTYTYNALNQLVKENDTVYKYDDAGNLISTTSSDKSAAYTYNAENKLIRATVNEAGKTVVKEYTYDYAGNRTSKTTGSETVKYLNDNSVLTNVLAEIDANGNELCYYTIGADLISQERSGKTSLYLYDGHGSVRGLIDENGKVTDTYNYDAFGNLLDKTGTTVNNYLYCGEQFDSATGLYYLRARYMNPATGTFITQDTYSGTVFDPTSLHKYLYANANPVMYIDPSGYFGLTDVVCANAIGNILFYGTSTGLINVGINLIRELRAAERYGTTVDFGYVITMSFTEGFLMGSLIGAWGMLAQSLNSALMYAALGGSSFIFASMSLAQAEADRSNGDYDLMALDLLFAAGGFLGAKNCFDNAYTISTASNTAKSSTNTSTGNTSTAKNSNHSNSSNNGLKRPSWRQSEIDARSNYPGYREQVSFENGNEVTYGTKGSVRPDFYKTGYSVDVKNYNISTAKGRTQLAVNIETQYYQRVANLPTGTKQSVLIDIRGQNISSFDLIALYNDIMFRTNNGISVYFKTN